MNKQRGKSLRIRTRSKSSGSLKRLPSLQSIKQKQEQKDQLLQKVEEIINNKQQISIITNFQKYKTYVLERAKQFKKFISKLNKGTIMILMNSKHFNVGLQQLLIKLFKMKRFTLGLDDFDSRSFMKVESWMITFVKRHLEIEAINKQIQTKHKTIENEISGFMKKVFDKRFEPWLNISEK